MYEINYYEDARDKRPVKEFIDGLPAKMRAKVSEGSSSLRCTVPPWGRCSPGISTTGYSS